MDYTELSSEAENDLYEYYVEKSKRPGDWYWKQANMISGGADIIPGYDDGEWHVGNNL